MKLQTRILVAFMTCIVLLTSMPVAGFLKPQKAEAQFAVFDPANLQQAILEFKQHFIEQAMKVFLESLKKQLLDMMVDQIVQWIQGGGKPQFVTDWSQFLSDAANVATGDFVKEMGLGFLCSPFSVQVQLSLLPVDKFTKQVTCTLDQITGNIENFYADFRNGGWIAYTTSLQPKNNYFGASLLAEADLDRRKGNAQEAALNEAQAGNGFLSTKKCDADGKCTITTPGNTIGDILSKAVGSDIDYLVNAEDLTAYMAAIGSAIYNRILIEGVDGLRGLTTGNAPPGGVVGQGAGPCAGLSGGSLGACLNYATISGNSFNNAKSILLDEINASLGPRLNADAEYVDSLTRIARYEVDLKNLLALITPIICINKAVYLADLNTELQYASSTALVVSNDKSLNQTYVAPLLAAKQSVTDLAANDWIGFGNLAAQLDASNAVDADAATAVKAASKSQNDTIQQRIAVKIQELNSDLRSCYSGN